MKRMLVLLMALSLCALPALAGQGPDVGPLSVEELNAFTEEEKRAHRLKLPC